MPKKFNGSTLLAIDPELVEGSTRRFMKPFVRHLDKLGARPEQANEVSASKGGENPKNIFARVTAEKSRPIKWCRGRESNTPRLPFQGSALPLSYLGIIV